MYESSQHVGDDAELYVLGDLDSAARVRIERHVRICAECARRLGDAESAILRLIEAQAAQVPATLRPFRAHSSAGAWRWAGAIAAAFVLGLLPWLLTLRSAAPSAQRLAMTAMLDSHFQHAQFVADAAGAPPAKVIYGRDGRWLYVLAAPGTTALSVVTVTSSAKKTVATLEPAAKTRATFVTLAARPGQVLLVEGTRQLAHANLVFAKGGSR